MKIMLYVHITKEVLLQSNSRVPFTSKPLLAEITYHYYDWFSSLNLEKSYIFELLIREQGVKQALCCTTQFHADIL